MKLAWQPLFLATMIRQFVKTLQYGTKTNQRLHAWSFAKLIDQIKYKAAMKGIKVALVSAEAYHKPDLSSMRQGRKYQTASIEVSTSVPVRWSLFHADMQFCSQYIMNDSLMYLP